VLFFGALFFYLWLVVKPCLIYDCATITNFPVFYKGWPFFRDCISQPGGLLKYISALLSHLFYYSSVGAAVITAQAWAISACSHWLFRIVRLPGARWLRFVPALLVLTAYAQYSYHLPAFMGVLASLWFAALYMAVGSRGPCDASARSVRATRSWLIPLAIYLVLSVISYVVSAAAYLPFAVLCVLYEVLYRRRYAVALFALSLAAALPYVAGVLVYRVSLPDAYTDLLPLSWHIRGWATRERMIAVVYTLYLFPMAATLAWGLWRTVATLRSHDGTAAGARPPGKQTQKHHVEPAGSFLSTIRRALAAAPVRWVVGSALLLAAAGAVAVHALDNRQKAMLEVHHYACRRMWPEVLEAARRCPREDHVINAVNRALYHTDRLGRDMFLYRQNANGLLLTGSDRNLRYWHVFDTAIDLGLINLAEKNLTECLESFGEHPMILERLALVNLIKGRIGAARIYLGALQKTLFHGRWADEYLLRLDADPTLSEDARIQHLRALCLKTDYTSQFYAKETMLRALVEQRTGNRMAYEYMMAWYMLTGQLPKLIEGIGKLDELGYAQIPPLHQEAILIYAYGTRKPVDLHGRSIDPEMRRRIEDFSRVVNRYGNDRNAAAAELAGDYRGSYFLHYFSTILAGQR